MKMNTMKLFSIVLTSIFGFYLIHLNYVVSKYESVEDIVENANYISTSETGEDVLNEVEVEEEALIENEIVYEGKTLDELTSIIEKSLNSTISGKGELITSYSLERGVDPFLATAIILHETGCKWGCSRLVNECNNVGGQKGKGCGSYAYFENLEEGIRKFIDNLYNNYISCGLTTPEEINSKYAEDPNWAKNVSKYIEIIKA